MDNNICNGCDCAIEIANTSEYLNWFYNTTVAIFFHDEKFEEKMHDRFYRATGKVAPSNIGF